MKIRIELTASDLTYLKEAYPPNDPANPSSLLTLHAVNVAYSLLGAMLSAAAGASEEGDDPFSGDELLEELPESIEEGEAYVFEQEIVIAAPEDILTGEEATSLVSDTHAEYGDEPQL